MAQRLSLFAFLFLLYSVNGFTDSKRSGSSFGWQILTRRNFSSEIRIHPHIFLIVTVPWSGESRTLMKEVAHRAVYEQENIGHIRLMVIYRNTDKLLADFLGASEGIVIFFYHHSVAYKYRGRLRLHNIFSSLHHLMSFQPDDLPLKQLNTIEDLKTFIQSTDKAVFLLEFCGWATRLLHKIKDDGRESTFYVKDATDNGEVFENNYFIGVGPVDKMENQKGLKIEELTCGIPSVGGFNLVNESLPPFEDGDRAASEGISCTDEEFQQFESFFSKFTKIAREHFLPPEKQRFGLVSRLSLLSFLGVVNPDTWSLMLHFPGCPNCSKILNKPDDIQSALLMRHTPVIELEGETDNLEPALPGNAPSIVLFVDRSSRSSKIRRKSKLALEIFRKLSLQQNSIFSEKMSAQNLSMRTKSISDHSGCDKDRSPVVKMLKFKDKMAHMIVRKGGNVALDDVASDTHGKSAQDILNYLLQQKNAALPMKKAKVSSLAKEVGFQLLSDDFEVKIVEALPLLKEHGQSETALSSQLTSLETSELPITSDGVNSVVNAAVAKHDGQPELVHLEASRQCHQEAVPDSKENIHFFQAESALEAKKYELDIFGTMGIGGNDRRSKEIDVGQSLQLEQDSLGVSFLEEQLHIDYGQHANGGLNLNSKGQENLINDSSEAAVVQNGATEVDSLMVTSGEFEEHHVHDRTFKGSFFFSDGGYQLLGSLTAGSKIPSVVILDPVLQQHYVFPEERVFSHSSLTHFVDEFLNGSLPSFQRGQSAPASPKETPKPPFVNLDFHEADSIPQVTLNTFSELVLGFNQCDRGYALSCFDNKNIGPAWKRDVMVLFSNSWCGFCQRMELVVREVYRAFKGYMTMVKSEHSIRRSVLIKDNLEEGILNEVPSIFLMDCTLNDCRKLLKLMGQREIYPSLMLFPGEKKDAVPYLGDMSVANVIEFVAAHGSNSHQIIGNIGILWTGAQKGFRSTTSLRDTPSDPDRVEIPLAKGKYEVVLSSMPKLTDEPSQVRPPQMSDRFREEGQHVDVGSTLVATNKLKNVPPFDNSKVLIVKADRKDGFQGLITNKRIHWDILPELDKELISLKQAPLSFGGPVVLQGMPLVCFTRRASDVGYSEVIPSFYYGDQMTTIRVIEGIKSGNLSAIDYWFFLGYSSWDWNQLFTELVEGSWRTSNYQMDQLEWPES